MKRKPDPKLQEKRELALKLEGEGLNAVQIAPIVKRSPDVVRRWLRMLRGARKPVRADVLQHLADGLKVEEVAERIGVSPSHVWRIAKEDRGYLVNEVRSTTELIDLYLSDPKTHWRAPFTRYESFGRGLIHRTHSWVHDDPFGADRIIKLSIELFEDLAAKRRNPELKQEARCLLRQARFANAARERSLENLDAALSILETELNEARCQWCIADGRRRQAIVLRWLGRFVEAIKCLEEATEIYKIGNGYGHDYRQNGLGSCVLVKCQVKYSSEAYIDAMAVAESALEALGPGESDLFLLFAFTHAAAFFRTGADPAGLRRTLADLVARCGNTSSRPRAHCVWLSGRIEQALDNVEGAKLFYEDALYDFRSLEIPGAVAAVVADLATLSGSPQELRERLLDLREHNEALGRKAFPSWLRPVKHAIIACLEATATAAATDLAKIAERLREECGGNNVLPHPY